MEANRLRLVALVGLLGLSGCSSTAASVSTDTTKPSPQSGTWDTSKLPNPCRVITNDEVSKIIGEGAAVGRRLEAWPPMCDFAVGPIPQQGVYVADDSASTGKIDFYRRKQGIEVQEVIGVGEAAYWVPQNNTLHVLQGDTHLQVIVRIDSDADKAKELAEGIAGVALPRAFPQR